MDREVIPSAWHVASVKTSASPRLAWACASSVNVSLMSSDSTHGILSIRVPTCDVHSKCDRRYLMDLLGSGWRANSTGVHSYSADQ